MTDWTPDDDEDEFSSFVLVLLAVFILGWFIGSCTTLLLGSAMKDKTCGPATGL